MRQVYLGMKLSEEENTALVMWATSEGLEKSVLMRRLFRLALRDSAPHTIFPAKVIDALNLSQEAKTR